MAYEESCLSYQGIRANFSISSSSSDTMKAMTIRKPIPNDNSPESMRMKGPAIELRDLAQEPMIQLWMLYMSKFRLLEASDHQAPLILDLRSYTSL